MERDMGLEPATSSFGRRPYIGKQDVRVLLITTFWRMEFSGILHCARSGIKSSTNRAHATITPSYYLNPNFSSIS